MNMPLAIRPEVAAALAEGRAIVAIESAVLAHGMPYPQNIETARRAEAAVRAQGGVPATIAILDGRVQIGLSEVQLESLATAENVVKVSRRDLPVVLADRRAGATTVAATLIAAEWAGIALVVTGGIGGVHRGGENSLDISADLAQLARSRTGLVCAGAKSILDIGRSLEVLETLGVTVLGYQTDRFPAFYCPDSGVALAHRVETAEQAAQVLRLRRQLDLAGGVVIANPVPVEHGQDPEAMEKLIQRALAQAEADGIQGKALTPFVLASLARLGGESLLRTNQELICHNAAVAAEVAVALVEGEERGA